MNIANRQPNWAKTKLATAILPLSLLLGGCGDDDLDPNDINAPDVYEFASLTDPSAPSSVDYREAISQTILINELAYLLESDRLQNVQASTQAIELINSIFEVATKNTIGNSLSLIGNDIYNAGHANTQIHFQGASNLPSLQTDFTSILVNTNIKENIPGQNFNLPLRNESGDKGNFIGWVTSLGTVNIDGDLVPNKILQDMFIKLSLLASDDDPDTRYITNNPISIDHKTFISTFLLGSIHYFLINEVLLNPNVGLLSENSTQSDLPYTKLEHTWDMAFGYFGSARNANTNTDQVNLTSPDIDSNLDGFIDLESEINTGFAIEAMNLDYHSPYSDIDFSGTIISNYLEGRKIIQDYHGINPILGNELHSKLINISDKILLTLEKVVAASAIYYANQSILNLSNGYSALETDQIYIDSPLYLESWSKLKGYSLALQFNKKSQVDTQSLNDIHGLIGQAPKIRKDEFTTYLNALATAADKIQQIYKFSDENITAWGLTDQ